MIETEKTFDNKPIAYEIKTDGYEIYLDGQLWISQRGQYSKPVDKSKTYEENCLAQIENITAQAELPTPEPKKYTLDEAAALITEEVANEL